MSRTKEESTVCGERKETFRIGPASRGADPPPSLHRRIYPTLVDRIDPMTDSDFFTESDPDAPEEIVRGDRKTQVIDGTTLLLHLVDEDVPISLAELDSSGVYLDPEKRH
ncbi:hypothetical protein K0M31_004723 [Melipona bicolor]|uniref:Uncharacterized protein n=1 Tax=Melipona bicolor TaxID=60889 RepID=A0AA40KMM2_9HYME|nr:hypothetical protein K0M31_004723 [Melipona bicolor]